MKYTVVVHQFDETFIEKILRRCFKSLRFKPLPEEIEWRPEKENQPTMILERFLPWKITWKGYSLHGKPHRTDGPALETDIINIYAIHGEFFFSKKEYWRKVKLMAFS